MNEKKTDVLPVDNYVRHVRADECVHGARCTMKVSRE